VGLIPSIPLAENIGVKVHPKTKGPIVDESMMTSIPGIFACGNALHVHDLVDFVSLEAEKTGEKVSRFLKDQNAKSNRKMTVVPKFGINYLLPCQVNLDNTESITFNFRVNQPFTNVYLRILLNGKEIKKVKKAFMLPAEMETIELPSALLEAGVLEMEVANA
jgi:NAD(P)H-nitrite reductase large subunit